MERAASLRRRLQKVEREDPEVVQQAVLHKMREDLRKMKAERQTATLAHLNRCPQHLSSHQPAKSAVRNAPRREAAVTRLEGGCHKTWSCRKKKTRRGTRGRGRRWLRGRVRRRVRRRRRRRPWLRCGERERGGLQRQALAGGDRATQAQRRRCSGCTRRRHRDMRTASAPRLRAWPAAPRRPPPPPPPPPVIEAAPTSQNTPVAPLWNLNPTDFRLKSGQASLENVCARAHRRGTGRGAAEELFAKLFGTRRGTFG